MVAPYRADQVGSLLRPPGLLAAREAHAEGRMEQERLRKIEDEAILEVLDLQRQAGMDVFTDGEYRRREFRSQFADAVEGMGPVSTVLDWRGPNSATIEPASQWEVSGKLHQRHRLTGDEASFMKEHSPGAIKVTMPSATMMGRRSFTPGVTDKFYPTLPDLLQELAGIVRAEIQALIDEGVPYVQLDAPNYTFYLDKQRRERMRQSGIDPDQEMDETIAADNSSLQDLHREGVTLAIHLCRGNNRSAWHSEGGYDAVAERVFSSLQADSFLLEYDTDRAGGFEPLRFVPRGKTVVLGLITTKEGRLESQEHLRRRIEEASKYVPNENLAISPQCGFATMYSGNLLSWEDQRRKLELVASTARNVWG